MPDIHDVQLVVVTRNRATVLTTYALPGLVEIAGGGSSVLVVDQSDDDDTERIVRGTDVEYLRTTSRGLARGRNEALFTGRSAWIAFTDDDMRPTPTWLAAITSATVEHPDIGAVLGRGVNPDGELMAGGPPGRHGWPTDVFTLGSGYSFAVARQSALQVGGFHPQFGAGAWFGAAEDTLMLYRLLQGGFAVLCDDRVQIEHPEWRSGTALALRQFRYGRGTAALAWASLAEREGTTIGHAYARMVRQGRRIGGLLRSGHRLEAARQACYLVGAVSALDAPMVLTLRRRTSKRLVPDETGVARDR